MVIETITIVVNVVNEQYSVFVVGNLSSSKHGQLEGYGVRVLQGSQTGKYMYMIVCGELLRHTRAMRLTLYVLLDTPGAVTTMFTLKSLFLNKKRCRVFYC